MIAMVNAVSATQENVTIEGALHWWWWRLETSEGVVWHAEKRKGDVPHVGERIDVHVSGNGQLYTKW